MRETLSFAATPSLREHAIDALRRARRLPIGAARNDLRQLAIGLRFLAEHPQPDISSVIPYIRSNEAPLAPL